MWSGNVKNDKIGKARQGRMGEERKKGGNKTRVEGEKAKTHRHGHKKQNLTRSCKERRFVYRI
jgi:hypothetical protein